MITKRKPFRSRKVLDLAHQVNDCQLQIPGVCIGFSLEGCEPAHSNQSRHGKGAGQKADDNRHVAACHPCHVELDQGRMPRVTKAKIWDAAFDRTRELYRRMFGIDLDSLA